MRLVIFSPLGVSSAIGRVTGLVVAALIDRGHHVVVVRSEEHALLNTTAHALGSRIVTWEDEGEVSAAADAADTVIYQIGDNYRLHHGCLEWLPRLPGIVCLHDFFLGSLFRGWAERHRQQAVSVLRTWYGDDIARRYFSFEDSESLIENTSEHAPMTEWVASMAQGLVTHSSWGIERVLDSCPGPVHVAPLPYDAPGLARRSEKGGSSPNGDFIVLTLGHMNPNKRVENVIRAIGESAQLRDKAVYRLVGRIEPAVEAQLRALATRLGVRLSISGEVNDKVLSEAIDQADVVCSLRLPALEAASASTIEAMLYGKAVVVMDTGFYRELPDEYVRKVSPEREIPDLRRELEALIADPAQRQALGRGAADWAERTFRADNYAEKLTQLCTSAAAAAPAIEASRYFAETLVNWGASGQNLGTTHIVEPLRIFER